MGRASFGGSADYSSLFANLYGNLGASEGGTGSDTAAQAANLRYQYEAKQLTAQQYADALRALAATGDQTSTNHFNLLTTAENALQAGDAEAKKLAADTQAASDQTAADQWANGMMSDQDWLAYVADRVTKAPDAQDKAQWEGYLSKYTTQIADNSAEGAYKAGGSVNDLILYYQGKLGSVGKNTQEYRDTQVRLNDLQDQRSSTALQDGANAISEKINKGTATYQDLLKFYQKQLPGVRPGSDLYKQVQSEITKVRDTIDTNTKAGALEKLQYDYNRGAITGASFAKGIRSAAAEFQKNDPQKYYQMLESAVQLDKNPGFIGAAGRASSAAAAKNKALAATVDQFQAQRDNLLALVNQADAGQKTGYDAVAGKTVTFTPKLVDQLDTQILDTYKALAAAHDAKGDHSAAQADMASMSKYITQGAGGNTVGIIGHNTAKTEDTYTALVLSTVKELQGNAESANPDPQVVADVASKWAKYAKSLEYKTTTQYQGGGRPGAQVVGAAKDQLHSVDPGFVSRVRAITGALTIQATGGTPEAQQAASDALATAFGADPAFPDASPGSKAFQNIAKNLVDPAYQIATSAAGLRDGTVTRVVDSSGKLGYYRVAPQSPTDIADGIPSQPALGSDVYDPGKGQKLVQVVIDINGRPTAVTAVAQLAASNQRTWAAAKDLIIAGAKVPKGTLLTNDQVDALTKDFGTAWKQDGKASLGSIAGYYSVQTPTWVDGQGKTHASETWVQDAETNQWYKDKLPIRGVQYRPDGSVQVIKGAEGPQYLVDYSSFADASGVPAPYVGENPQKVGSLIGAPGGLRLDGGLRGRDLNGYVTDTPTSNPAFAYFDPVTDINKNPANRDSWWQDEQRQTRSADVKAKLAAAQNDNPAALHQEQAIKRNPIQLPQTSIASSLMGFAKALGLNLGGATSAAPATRGGAVATPDDSRQSLQGEQALGRQLQLPQTHSGPVVSGQTGFTLNLPSTKAATIGVPVIKMPTTTATQVTTAAKAAAAKALATLPVVKVPTSAPVSSGGKKIAAKY